MLFAQAPNISYPASVSFNIGNAIKPIIPTNNGGAVPQNHYGQLSNLAGGGIVVPINGTTKTASFTYPNAVAVDNSGNIYVADGQERLIRLITPAGVVTTFAGVVNSNGINTTSTFLYPQALAIDGTGNIYVADAGYNQIFKIDPFGNVNNFAGNVTPGSSDGTGSAASFNGPTGVATDALGNVYVVDRNNQLIRKITPVGVVTTIAGNGSVGSTNGVGTAASFFNPQGIAIDAGGNLYIADAGNQLIRKIDTSGVVSTLAGGGPGNFTDGTGTAASFYNPSNLATDVSGNVYVSDSYGNRIRKISPSGVVTTLAGNGLNGLVNGAGVNASFNSPAGITVDAAGNAYIADYANRIIRKIDHNGIVSTFAGTGAVGQVDGTGNAASFSNSIFGVADAAGNVYIADSQNNLIRKISPSGVVTTIAGSGLVGSADGIGTAATFNAPQGIAIDAAGNIYIADSGNFLIRKISTAGVVTTLAGKVGISTFLDGTGTAAGFANPKSLTTDVQGNIYVADNNVEIRKISPTGVVTTFAGNNSNGSTDGTGTNASFYSINGLTTDSTGNIYVSDGGSNLIRKVTPQSVVTTIAGNQPANGIVINFADIAGITNDAAGNIYVVDRTNNIIDKIDTKGAVTTLDGSGAVIKGDFLPVGVTTDAIGNLIVMSYNTTYKIPVTGYTIKPSLPMGLNFDYTTGTISGTPISLASATTYTINAYNLAGSSGATISLSINNFAINSFSPATAASGTTVAISGLGFTGATAVSFGGSNAQSFNILADTLITAVVGTGTSGPITITIPSGTISLAGFNYITAPNISYPASIYFKINHPISAISPTNKGGAVPSTAYHQVSTFAGSGAQGSINGSSTVASFNVPYGVTVDAAGNVYVADSNNHLIRKIDAAGNVSTFAGSGYIGSSNGNGTSASFYHPAAVATDLAGNVYVADTYNNLIRKIDHNGNVSTLAGNGAPGFQNGLGSSASFYYPRGVATDASGNVYVADAGNNLIRKIDPTGMVSTFAGIGYAGSTNGISTVASFNNPSGVTTDGLGNIFVADRDNNQIRKIDSSGLVTTLAGNLNAGSKNGTGNTASFNRPYGITADKAGNVYVADLFNNLIRKIDSKGQVTTLAGNGSKGSINDIGTAASFSYPIGVTTDNLGNVYVADTYNNLIREISTNGYSISPSLPSGLNFDATTGTISGTPTAIDTTVTYVVTAYNLAGNSSAAFNFSNQPSIASFSPMTAGSGQIVAINGVGFTGVTGVSFGGSSAQSFKVLSDTVITAIVGSGASGSISVIASSGVITINGFNYLTAPKISYPGSIYYTANHAISAIIPTNTGGAVPANAYGQVSTFAGNGTIGFTNGSATSASFNQPYNVVTDTKGNVYISDLNNNSIRKINPLGTVSTLAGSGVAGSSNGNGIAASFNNPFGITADGTGNVYVADGFNNLIRKVDTLGNVNTMAGNGSQGFADGKGTAASFFSPYAVATDLGGNLYVADTYNYLIRKINQDGQVTTLAGSGLQGSNDGTGTSASFNIPIGITVDAVGNVYVADIGSNLIRKIDPNGNVTTYAGNGLPGATNGANLSASFNWPTGLATDALGNVYVADVVNGLIRKISQSGFVTTLAGNGTQGAKDGIGQLASFYNPKGVATDNLGNIYVADTYNNLIRKISITGYSISPSLPSGLNFDATTGTISGTPSTIDPTVTYVVTAYNLAGSSSATFNFHIQPTINSFSPVTAGSGQTVVINGVGFTGATAVGFGGSSAQSFKVLSDTVIVAVVGAGASGSISVTATSGAITLAGFNFITIPNIAYPAKLSYVVNHVITAITPTNTGGAVPANVYGQVSTFAGTGTPGYTDGIGTAASFNYPYGVATDLQGNVYVADEQNQVIRKISPSGVVTTLAGSGKPGNSNGTGLEASFKQPSGVATDAAGNVYVADNTNQLIRKITPAGTVTTLAGNGNVGSVNGTGTAASFDGPFGVATDVAGNVYVADEFNNLIRKITPNGAVTTLAGSSVGGNQDGVGTSASFNYPSGVATDAIGNIYVADGSNNLIRKISSTGVVTTLAGNNDYGSLDGTGSEASFSNPFGTATDAIGNIYVADTHNNLIRKITPSGVVTTIAGSSAFGNADGIGKAASFSFPTSVATDAVGNLYIADYTNHSIRKIPITGYSISPSLPSGLNFDGNTGTISGTPLIVAPTTTYTVTAYNLAGSSSATFSLATKNPGIKFFTPVSAGSGETIAILGNGFKGTTGVSFGGSNAQSFKVLSDTLITAVVSSGSSGLVVVTGSTGTITLDGFKFITAPNISYPAIQTYTINQIFPPILATNTGGVIPFINYGQVTILAGGGSAGAYNGTGVAASFNSPSGVAADLAGNIYVADKLNHLIRKITPTGNVTTYAGNGTKGANNGIGTASSFNLPIGIATDLLGNVYVADYGNNLIRKIDTAGQVTTFAGSGTIGSANGLGLAASFNLPNDVATDAAGNVYVADKYNNLIRKIDITGLVTTYAGNGVKGATNGAANMASFNNPSGLATDLAGNVYVADLGNNLIRKIDPFGMVTTIAGSGAQGATNGTSTTASFNYPEKVATDCLGNIYVADYGNNLIRKIDLNGQVTTIAGNRAQGADSGIGIKASFNRPIGLVADLAGNIYVADYSNNQIRKIGVTGYAIESVLPEGLSFDGTTGTISGTPTKGIQTTNYKVSAYNLAGSSNANISLSVFALPTTNFNITITGETCNGSSNGTVIVKADSSLNYTAVLTGNGINNTQKFTTTTTFSNLPVGTYTLTFTVDGQTNYSNAYTVTITQPQPLSVFATVNDAAGNIELNLSGGSVYHIQVNDKTYTTTESSFTVPLEQGNNALQVTTDRECQGVFTKLINPSLITAPYPMPFEGTLNLNLGSSNIATVSVRIYSANTGLQVFTADYQNKSGVLQLDLSRLDKGAYGLFLKLNNNQQEFKIIK